MKKVLFSVLALALLSGAAHAQGGGEKRGWGYVFVAPGVSTGGDSNGTLHVGGGGEALLAGGFGIGGEIGRFSDIDDLSDGAGIASVNLAYHFRNVDGGRRVVPFVTGGPSLGFRGGASSGGGNFGGGAQYWLGENVGLRFEVRTHVFSSDRPFNVGFRVGLSFR